MTHLLSHSFCGSSIWAQPNLGFRVFQRLWSRCWPRLEPHVKGWLGKHGFPDHFLLAGLTSVKAVGLMASVPWWLLPGGHPQFLARRSFHQSKHTRVRTRMPERESWSHDLLFFSGYNLLEPNLSGGIHHICHILFIKNKGLECPVGQVVKDPPLMRGTWVPSLLQEDPTCCRATKPMFHNYWVLSTLEPMFHNKRSHVLQLESRPCLLQLEKAHSYQWRASTAENT